MDIICLGNQIIEEDRIALEIADELKIDGFNLIPCTDSDSFMRLIEDKEEVYILDSAKGIKTIVLFNDLNKIKDRENFSSHDIDIGMMLKIMEGLGKLPKIWLIAFPIDWDKRKAKEEVKSFLTLLHGEGSSEYTIA